MIVMDIFRYFASFVPAEALKRTFRIPDGDDYSALMNGLLAGPSGREIDGITEYVFGTDTEKLTTVISAVTGIYLFVEYDRISSTVNTATDRKDDRLHVAVTVACPVPDSKDLVSSAIINDKCLEILSSIRRRMREDDDLKRGIEWTSRPR